MIQVAVAVAGDLLREAMQTCLHESDMGAMPVEYPAGLLALVAQQRVTVALLDDQFQPGEWIGSLAEQLLQASPALHIAVIGSFCDGAFIAELLESGVRGYLYRGDVLCPLLPHAVRVLAAGKPYLSTSASVAYLLVSGDPRRALPRLDHDMLRVLRLTAEGRGAREIALQLGVTLRRVYWLQLKLRRRFAAATTAEAVSKAGQQGYLGVGSGR